MRRLLLFVVAVILTAPTLNSFALAQQETPRKEAPSPAALGPAETLTGSLMMVDSDKKIILVRSAAGVPYNFLVTPGTRITAQNQRLKFADLASRKDQRVTVRFVPTRRGNLARSIELTP